MSDNYSDEYKQGYRDGMDCGVMVGKAQAHMWMADLQRIQAAKALRELREWCRAEGRDWGKLCQEQFNRSADMIDLEIACPMTISGLTYDELLAKLRLTPEEMRRIFLDGREAE